MANDNNEDSAAAVMDAPSKPRLADKYSDEILAAMKERFSITNDLAAPRLSKIVINMGVGRAKESKGVLEAAVEDLKIISGQQPKVTRAKLSVSGFKLRDGMAIGCKVTLRGRRMFEFLDRLISVVIPRIKDFRGLSRRAFDGGGNYSMGLGEQSVFPEIEADQITSMQGMDITIVTTTEEDAKAEALLEAFGMPFKR